MSDKCPEIIVFAGSNGSGKSTLTKMANVLEPYINADVPTEKILSRYAKALNLLPDLLEICDVCHIYDNSIEPFRIFKKRKNEYFFWVNHF